MALIRREYLKNTSAEKKQKWPKEK